MFEQIQEGNATVNVPAEKKISKDLPVFYNPIMKLNRDVSVDLLKTVKKDLQVGLPLAGTGVRAARFLTELKNIKLIAINDLSSDAVDLIRKNLNLNKNKIKCKDVTISNEDANKFLLNSKGFDYIDIDPFGSPNNFLENSIRRLAREGILAVTATDTGAMSGTFPKACVRKYWAKPLRNELMHEIGIRILIRKVQLMGVQNDRALIPILSYSKDHYFRIFFRCEKGKEKADNIIKQHSYLLYCPKCLNRELSKFNSGECSCGKEYDFAGPLYNGDLQDKKVLKKVKNEFVQSLYKENETPFFYDIHAFAKSMKLATVGKTIEILEKVRKKDKKATLTHFRENSIKTKLSVNEFKKILKNK